VKKLTINFGQLYLEAGVSYSFNGKFLSELEQRISRKLCVTEKLLKKFPTVQRLCFRIDASTKLEKGVVRIGEFIARRAEAEMRLILPYAASDRNKKRRSASGVKHLVDTLGVFFKKLDMDVPEEWCKAEIVELFLENYESYVYDIG
jgi:hypothetical protein